MNSRAYFCFISYSRKDSGIANSIHRAIEGFRYPSCVEAAFRPLDPRYVRDVFIDKKCLACTNESFRKNLREALKATRYLIVVCSPHSARPNATGEHFVNDEIVQFLEANGGDFSRILPVVVEGGVENLPPALRVPEFLGAESRNVPVLGKEEGAKDEFVSQILSFLLHLDLQVVRSRINAQRVCFWRKCVMAGVALAGTFMAMSFGMYVLKREADYNRVVAQERAVEIGRQAEEVNRQRLAAERNAEMAERQKRISEGALEFMMETFAQGDPTHSGRYDVKVSEALESRLSEVDKLEPWELRAFVSARVGSLLDNIGAYTSASNLLFSAYDLNRTHRPESEETAYTLYLLSWWHTHQYDYKRARDRAMEALRIYESCGLTNAWALAQAHNAIGMISMHLGKRSHDLVECHLLRAQELREAAWGASHPKVAVGLKNLGYLYRARHQSVKALDCFERALAILRNANMEDETLAQSLLGVAFVYRDMADYEEALVKFDEALKIRIATSGLESRGVVNVFKEIGNTQRSCGQYEEACRSYDKSLQISMKVLGEKDPVTIDLQRSIEATQRQWSQQGNL